MTLWIVLTTTYARSSIMATLFGAEETYKYMGRDQIFLFTPIFKYLLLLFCTITLVVMFHVIMTLPSP